MKQSIIIVTLALLMAGCSGTQPEFDPSVMKEVVVEGKTFSIPEEAVVSSSKLATKKEIAFYKKSGVEQCKDGDIIWEARSAAERVAKAIKNGDATIHTKLAKEGRIGCASPLAK